MPRSKKSRSLFSGISPKNRRYIMLGIAGMVAFGTWNLINTQLSKQPDVIVKEVVKEVEVLKEEVRLVQLEPEVEILVAAKNMPAGQLVGPKLLEWKSWPNSEGLDRIYAVKGKTSMTELSGAVVRQGIRAGEPIFTARLVKPGERGFLAAVLEPGHRAVSVPINSVTGIAGFIFPGDRVDVILTHQVTEAERTVSETVLRDIRVLAIDQQSSDQLSAPLPAKIATIEVTPSQAERVMVMMNLGQLSLVLRGLSPQEAEEQRLSGNPVEQQVAALAAEDAGMVQRAVLTNAAPDSSNEIPEGRYSWDSDVSRFIPAPKASAASYTSVQVFRAGEAKRLSFIKDRNGRTRLQDQQITNPDAEGAGQ